MSELLQPSARMPSMPGQVRDARTKADSESTATIRPPWQASSVAKVRRAVVGDLAARGLPLSIVDEAEIVASELVSNAVRHARPLSDGTIRVTWKVRGDVVEIDVTDGGGGTTPKAAPRALWAPSGRGLRIVRSIAHEWGVSENRSGTTVWASIGGPSRRRSH